MKRFLALLKKELLELVTLQTLLPFVAVVVAFGALGQMLSSVGPKAAERVPVALVDRDGGAYAEVMRAALEQAGVEVRAVEAQGAVGGPQATDGGHQAAMRRAGAKALVEIPVGFTAGIDTGRPQRLAVWVEVRGFSFLGNEHATRLAAAVEAANAAVAAAVAQRHAAGVDPAVLQRPVVPAQHVVIGSRSAEISPEQVLGFVTQQTTLIPIVLFVVIIFSAQMVASAVATEKETKTLEALLSCPVSRASIVAAKMLAAALVALVGAAAYMAGMRQYMAGVERGLGAQAAGGSAASAASEAALRALGLRLDAGDYVLLGLTLFAGILVALAIAVVLGAFAESVRSAQALLTPLMMLLLVPYMLSMFLDLQALPDAARTAVMAIPFTHVFLAGPSLFMGETRTVWFGIAYQLAWFAAFVAIAARVFASDRILTMRLGKRRG